MDLTNKTFTRSDKLPFDPRPQLSRVFVEGFYDWIKYFHKDKYKLINAFIHVFDLQYFYVLVDESGGEKTIAGMVACTQGYAPIALDRKIFARELGFFRGNFAHFMLKRHMVRNAYPFSLGAKTGSIEFVATSPDYRGQGIARDLITYAMKQHDYDSYVLEVADNNKAAVSVYTNLGFKEIKRVKGPRNSGVDFFLYMRKDMTEEV